MPAVGQQQLARGANARGWGKQPRKAKGLSGHTLSIAKSARGGKRE